MRRLRRRPFDAGLEQVAVALAGDPRPEVRLAAGRLAKTLFVFGRRSARLERVARELLVDQAPNVAALFAGLDAHSFESARIVDLIVARLREDDRELERATGILAGRGTVRDHVLRRLRNELYRWRLGRPFSMRPARGQIATWWRGHRESFAFGPDARLVLDWTGTCRLGERTVVRGLEGPLGIQVRTFEEGWLEDRPVYTAFVQLWKQEDGE